MLSTSSLALTTGTLHQRSEMLTTNEQIAYPSDVGQETIPEVRMANTVTPEERMANTGTPEVHMANTGTPEVHMANTGTHEVHMANTGTPEPEVCTTNTGTPKPEAPMAKTKTPEEHMATTRTPEVRLANTRTPEPEELIVRTPEVRMANANTPEVRMSKMRTPEVRMANTRSRTLRSASTPTEKGDEAKTTGSSKPSNGQQIDRPDRAYATGGRTLRKKRGTSSEATNSTCTVCGVTIRPSELQSHYEWEVEKLNNMRRPDGSRYREPGSLKSGLRREQKSDKEKRKSSSSSSSKRKKEADDEEEDEDEDVLLDPQERRIEFDRVKSRRQERLYSRVRKSMRANLEVDDAPSTSNCNSDDTTTCPICQIVLTGTPEERNSHAEACLLARSSSGAAEEDEDIDVEGESFEEYTWCGQTRVRAASLLETGYKGLGYEVGNQSTDVDTELNIESDDDSNEFGPAQFTEANIPCASDEMDIEMQTLRNAVLEGSQERVPPLHQEDSNVTNCHDANSSEQKQEETPAESSSSSSPNTKETFQSNPLYLGQSKTVLHCLRARIEELEELVNKQNTTRCLICMESYKTPTVSVQCWHVHCKECWLRTLGAKKLCPQCNMITSPNQLRQIYL